MQPVKWKKEQCQLLWIYKKYERENIAIREQRGILWKCKIPVSNFIFSLSQIFFKKIVIFLYILLDSGMGVVGGQARSVDWYFREKPDAIA